MACSTEHPEREIPDFSQPVGRRRGAEHLVGGRGPAARRLGRPFRETSTTGEPLIRRHRTCRLAHRLRGGRAPPPAGRARWWQPVRIDVTGRLGALVAVLGGALMRDGL